MGQDGETIELLRNAAASFASFDGKRIRGWRERAPGFDRNLWLEMGKLGWLSILVPQEEGGLGLGMDATAAIAGQLGLACAPEPFVLKLDVVHLADAYHHFTGIVVRGEPHGQDISYLKIWATETFQQIADLVVETAGPFAAINGEVEIAGTSVDVLASFYKARPPTIYGGSSEIQRIIVARQVLGLPSRSAAIENGNRRME